MWSTNTHLASLYFHYAYFYVVNANVSEITRSQELSHCSLNLELPLCVIDHVSFFFSLSLNSSKAISFTFWILLFWNPPADGASSPTLETQEPLHQLLLKSGSKVSYIETFPFSLLSFFNFVFPQHQASLHHNWHSTKIDSEFFSFFSKCCCTIQDKYNKYLLGGMW